MYPCHVLRHLPPELWVRLQFGPRHGVPPSGGETGLVTQSSDPGTENHSSVPPAKAGTPCQNPRAVHRLRAWLWLLALAVPVWLAANAGASCATNEHGMVATVHPLATEAGIRALRQGGNAIDAAVAAALTLGVVDGHNSGIGGGCFMLIHLADGKFVAIDGRETAPALAARDMFVRDGKADPRLSQIGALASGVPGALAVYGEAVEKYGKLKLETHLLAAAGLAEKGFPINGSYARALKANADHLKRFAAAQTIFFNPDGSPLREGDRLRQPDLALTYRKVAEAGLPWFYGGPFAAATDRWMGVHDGLIRRGDFEQYRARRREPVRTTYRGCEIIGFPPPGSGGVHVAQILNILETFDLKALGANSAELIHIVAEAMKLAFADRAHWLGDPDFCAVPRGLVGKPYAAQLAKRIQRDRVVFVSDHGTPERATKDVFGGHTTHFSTADAAGNWVACTATINTSFGSKVVIPGTGVVLNSQMDDFSIRPGTANYFGLLGSEANAVAPGKRPLSSMSPTLVLREGKPILAVGAAGGPSIISQTVLAIIYVIDFDLPIEAALAQTRFHHQWMPNKLYIEKSAGKAVLRELARRGHKLDIVQSLGAAQAVAAGSAGCGFTGGADPRGEGRAEGF